MTAPTYPSSVVETRDSAAGEAPAPAASDDKGKVSVAAGTHYAPQSEGGVGAAGKSAPSAAASRMMWQSSPARPRSSSSAPDIDRDGSTAASGVSTSTPVTPLVRGYSAATMLYDELSGASPGLDHLFCDCDEDLALCGKDISDEPRDDGPWYQDDPDLCVVCAELGPHPCERCGEP